ncbi:MAG: methyl-accepting chemotaxis protein, partial [Pseudomonadota bacterium]
MRALLVRYEDLKIAYKLPLIVVGCCLLVAVSLTIASIIQATSSLRTNEAAQIETVGANRAHALSTYLASIEEDLALVADLPFTLEALRTFDAGWKAQEGDPTQIFQRLYIENNPHPTGSKENLDAADDGSLYSRAHAAFHPWFRNFLRTRGYYDIFLFNPQGDLIYTVFKELDYATNLVTGEYRATELGSAFRVARD